MKKYMVCALTATALIALSCAKENAADPSKGENPGTAKLTPGLYPASISVGDIQPDAAPETRAALQGKAFSWEAGDAIACYQCFGKVANPTDPTNIITRMTTTGDGIFTGQLPYTEAENYNMNFIYPASAVKAMDFSEVRQECVRIELPATQDGRLANIGRYFITGAYNQACTVNKAGDEIVSVSAAGSVSLSKHAVTVFKLDVPAALAANSLQIRALKNSTPLGLAGEGYFNLHNMQMKTSPLSCDVLTISRLDASAISGDTYACAMPLVINNSNSPATKVEIAVVGANGTYTFAKEVSGLARGTIYDLGSLPTACIAPKISIDTEGRAVMTATPAEAAIYYTTDGSDPSSASTLYEGPVEITGAVTIKAIAVCSGLGNSGITSYSYDPAAGAVAPVLSINAAGSLVVAAEDGHSYKYSISTTGDPGEPDTAFPAEGIDLKSTGSHYIRVEADFSGKTATTNALYRVYYISSALPSGTKVELNASKPVDAETFAPFTATWFASSGNEGQTCTLSRGTNGLYWKTNVSNPSAYTIYIGLETRYASDLSLHAFCSATTNVYPRYCGIRGGTAEDGVEVPASISGGITQTDWSAWWSIKKASAGKMIEFAVPNSRLLRGWGVLEQGFAAFGPAQASVSTEKPGIGKIVNY